MSVYGIMQTGVGVVSMANNAIRGDWEGVGRAGKLFLGNFYIDANEFFGGIGQGFSRHTWEMLQTFGGHFWSQEMNLAGNVSRVDFFGGATFATQENAGFRNGVALGNFININWDGEITGNFRDWVANNPLYMHEYGHTFDSRRFGLFYLPIVGISSARSANRSSIIEGDNPLSLSTHRVHWTETRANRHASRYFRNQFGINWETQFPQYPLRNPFR